MTLEINSEALFNELKFKADVRNWPDNRRRAQFRQGWHEAGDETRADYTAATLKELTWRNLGYRLGQKFGEAALDEIDRAYDQFAEYYYSQRQDGYKNPAATGYPTPEMYKTALLAVEAEITPRQRQILAAHYQSDDYLTSASDLAGQLGLDDFVHINREYGHLGSLIAQALDLYIPSDWIRLNAIATCIGESAIRWLLHPQMVQALDSLGWFKPGENLLQDLQAAAVIAPADITDTTRRTVVESRVGQGLFRANLIRYWQGCALTQCQEIPILKASHIKPWRVATNEERLDHYNGLLLTPNLDALFDKGLITFIDNGEIVLSGQLSGEDRGILGVTDTMKLAKIEDRHKSYLAYHRDHVFKR